MNSKRKTILPIAIVLAVIVLAGLVLKYTGSSNGSTGDDSPQYADNHSDHDDHDDHDKNDQDGDSHDDEKEFVLISKTELSEFGIEVATAGPGKLKLQVTLPGEIAVNADRLAHIAPRVPGAVSKVLKSLGDSVRAGEIMAVIESRELADAKAGFLATRERLDLAEANFKREEGLWHKRITSEQEYLDARQAAAEARIELRSAEQKLHALGFSDKFLTQLPNHPDKSFTQYFITAPFAGTVIEKHITLGEVLQNDSKTFVVADLSSVWIDLRVYQKDLPLIRQGLPVTVSIGHGIPDVRGEISWVRQLVGEETQTALARIVLPNPDGLLRPGLFVTGSVTVENADVPILVEKTALQTLGDQPGIFIETPEGFEVQRVTIGRTDESKAEILSGITPGQRYAAKGAFTLKAQLAKGTFESGHNH